MSVQYSTDGEDSSMTTSTYHFITDQNIPMVARFVRKGDRYGLNGFLTHNEDDPVVEFYDARFDHNEWAGFIGQFISRYCLSTLEEGMFELVICGLDLDGGIPDWKVDAGSMRSVFQWIDLVQSNV
jgi:hypothetical protein